MAAFFNPGSLQGKITSAYITLVVCTAVLGFIAFSDLLFLERQISEGKVVANLKDTVLKMRCEEKNLFLSIDTQALSRVKEYANLSLNILQQHHSLLASLMPASTPLVLTDTLSHYRSKLAQWPITSQNTSGNSHKQPGRKQLNRQQLQNELNQLSQQIAFSIEALSRQERDSLETAVQESQWLLLFSLLVIGLSIYIVGHQLKRVVVTPLQQLESRLDKIGKGQLKHLQAPSNDREFITFTRTINRMLKQLEVNQKRILQSEKLASLGILAAGVAHELNNPLSNISSSCQLLMEELNEADPAQLNNWLQQIDSETERGRKIVRTLLDFGQQRVFHQSPHNLLDLVNETQLFLGKTLQQKTARLSLNIAENVLINVDKQRFQQLFINLIQNALHAGGEGVHIRISAMLCEPGMSMFPDNAEVAGDLKCLTDYQGRFIEILVSDDGPGIPSEQLSKVFDPFYTTSEPGYGAGYGVGLGLYIVHEIVGEHNGCVAINSLPGKGTQIIVLLPAEEGNNE